MILDFTLEDITNGWNEFWYNAGLFFMTPDSNGISLLARIGVAVGIIVIAWLLIKILVAVLRKVLGVKRKGPQVDISAKLFVIQIIKIALWVGVAFVVISVLGINTTGFAGIASAVTVALGLSLQDVVACLASGLLIINQKHIRAGDYIKVSNSFGSCEGTVVRIQFIFTYLKSADGLEITIPNNNVLKAVIYNYTRLGSRRVDLDVDVSYESDIELCKKVFYEILNDDEATFKDGTINVYVSELGPYSVKFRLRAWVAVNDYWPFRFRLSENVLIKCRENNIYIPCSTDRHVSNVEPL